MIRKCKQYTVIRRSRITYASLNMDLKEFLGGWWKYSESQLEEEVVLGSSPVLNRVGKVRDTAFSEASRT